MIGSHARASLLALLLLLSPGIDVARADGSVIPSGPGLEVPFPENWGELRIGAEFHLNFRHSSDERVPSAAPFPEELLPADGEGVALETVAPGSSIELSLVRLVAGLELGPAVEVRTAVHVLDRYSANPSSRNDVLVREAWVRFGHEDRTLAAIDEASVFVLAGRAPRFSQQSRRRLESYGLWGTALARFEQDQILLGGTLPGFVYWRAMVSSGNPLFFRDPNALAGDNGTSEGITGDRDPDFRSGFPILYDAAPTSVDFDGEVELGGGLGLRLMDDEGRDGLDILAWYFQRELADAVPLAGTEYEGDLDILSDPFGNGLPASGDRKREGGVNLEGRYGNGRLFAQYVMQSIADLDRQGGEIELAYRWRFPALFALGDLPAITWLEPAFRFSWIDNDFEPVGPFVAPSTVWDWRKYDVGIRAGIVRGIDLAVEYSRNDAETAGGSLHPDELLATLSVAL